MARGGWRLAIGSVVFAGVLLFSVTGRSDSGREGRQIVALGQVLFSDVRLSAGGGLSCASCHRPDLAWSDGARQAVGERGRVGRRNTPTLAGVFRRGALFWDGAAADLNTATTRPLFDPLEMANKSEEDLLGRMQDDAVYRSLFDAAFGSPEPSMVRIAGALAAFVGTLERQSRYDRYRAGEMAALNGEEIRGLEIFNGKAGCTACHGGGDLTDDGFHNTGLAMPGETGSDTGRHGVTGLAADAGRFRTPTLRAVGITAPYMHNGAFPDLDAVVRFYERGGGQPWLRNAREAGDPVLAAMATVSPLIQPFSLSQEERRALVAFLNAL